MRLQKFDVYGNKLWDSAGLLVSDHTSDSFVMVYDLTTDGEDNAIIISLSTGKKIIPIGKSYKDKLMNDLNLISK